MEPQTASDPGPAPQEDSAAASKNKGGSVPAFIFICVVIGLLIIAAYIYVYVYFYSKSSTALTAGKGIVFLAGVEKALELGYKGVSAVVKQLKGLPEWFRAQWAIARNNRAARISGIVIIAAGFVVAAVGVPYFFDPYTHTGFCLPGGCDVSFNSFPDTAGPERCTPVGTNYEVIEPNNRAWRACISDATKYSNFVYEAKMTINSGDCGGLLFRTTEKQSQTYQFGVCANGQIYLTYYEAKGPKTFNPSTCVQPNGSKGSCALVNTTLVAAHQGPGRTNLIAVEADGSTLALYVNHTPVSTVPDTRFASGDIGVFAEDYKDQTSVTFSNVKVWPL